MSNKKTVKEMYAEVIAQAKEGLPLTAEMIAFIEGRAEISAKKSASKKETAKQTENKALKDAIVKYMSNEPNKLFTIGQLMKNVPELAAIEDITTSRTTSIIYLGVVDTKHDGTGEIKRVEDKGRAYFQYNGAVEE